MAATVVVIIAMPDTLKHLVRIWRLLGADHGLTVRMARSVRALDSEALSRRVSEARKELERLELALDRVLGRGRDGGDAVAPEAGRGRVIDMDEARAAIGRSRGNGDGLKS